MTQPQRVRMHSPAEAMQFYVTLLAENPSNATVRAQKEAYLDFYMHYGHKTDALQESITFTDPEVQILHETQFPQIVEQTHREVDHNLFWGSEPLPLQPHQLQSEAAERLFGCLDYGWMVQQLLSLYLAKHGQGEPADAARFENLQQAMEGTPYTIEGLMAVSVRDVMLFNHHQQHRQRDSRSVGLHPDALATRLLLDQRGVWDYLHVWLQSYAREPRDAEGRRRFTRAGYELLPAT